uniref:Uncharacterized protein n=1 Tax=Sphaerodactylus townsendi TaxID=933632 RepID=A0ACB8F4V3_9SAUR
MRRTGAEPYGQRQAGRMKMGIALPGRAADSTHPQAVGWQEVKLTHLAGPLVDVLRFCRLAKMAQAVDRKPCIASRSGWRRLSGVRPWPVKATGKQRAWVVKSRCFGRAADG